MLELAPAGILHHVIGNDERMRVSRVQVSTSFLCRRFGSVRMNSAADSE